MQLTSLWAALPIGIRLAGLMTFAPFFSHAAIPLRLRAALVVLVAILLVPVTVPGGAQNLTASGMVSMLLQESLVGFLLGLSVLLVFEAAQLAGQLLGVQVGVSIVTVLDPQTQAESPVLSMFLQTLLLLLFLEMDVHHWLLRGLVDSFRMLPAGALLTAPLTENLLLKFAQIWAVGVEISVPVLAATITADVLIAFLSKASPQMPVLLVGMPAKILLGLATLYGAIRYWPSIFDKQFAIALSYAHGWLQLAH